MGRCLSAVVLLVGMLAARDASANCARPVTYGATTGDGGVLIAPENFEERACPDPEGLVRQNVKTGEVVRIDTCEADAGPHDARFVDRCVPPGQYRYGFARPYDCAPSACWTDAYVDVSVTETPSCTAPAYAKVPAAPWGSGRQICSYNGRMTRVGLGILVVIIAFIGAILYGVVRMVRRKRGAA